MNYEKEKNKMIVRLVIGLILASGFFFLLSILNVGYSLRTSFLGVFIFVGMTCYPLAFSYGKGQMIDIFHSIHKGARQPFPVLRGRGTWQPVLNFCIAALTVVSLGWVYGAYYAYKRLQMMKSLH